MIGFTGTQNGMSMQQFTALVNYLRGGSGQFHHGDCIGSDKAAHQIARAFGYWIIGHPPIDPTKRAWCSFNEIRPEKPCLVRNREMVNEITTLIATPSTLTEQIRSGTWATVRYATKQHKTVMIILPDGHTYTRC